MNKNLKSFFKKKRNLKKYSLLVIIAVFLIVPEGRANASFAGDLWFIINNPLDAIMSPVYAIIFMILNIFLMISALWVMFGAWLVDTAMSPALYVGQTLPTVLPGVLNSTAVNIGWETVRDICNMFFMFFMLAVAFGTILRSKSFNVKNILPKIIIAMFLINFSMVITKMVIDISQFFMYEIATWMPSFSGEMGSLTSIVHMFNDEINFLNLKDLTRIYRFNDVVQVSTALLYSIILGAIYVMLAIFLLIRLVYFAVLIILSPFAFLSMALPSMSKHTAKWWGELSKWAIFGPVFMFFIFLSATMANEFVGQVDFYGPDLPSGLGFLGPAFYRVIMASIPIIMLLMAPQVAHELGVKGAAQLVGGRAGIGNIIQGSRGAGKKAWGAGKWGGAWGGRRIGKDSRDVGDYVRGKTKTFANKLPSKLPGKIGTIVGGKIKARIDGHLAMQEVEQRSEDRENVEKEKSIMKHSSGKSADAVAEGLINKRYTKGERLSREDESKLIASVEVMASKGEDISKFKDEFAMMGQRGANVDEIATFDPVSAGVMKNAMDPSKTEEQHTADYLEKHAETGDWKKYGEHFKQNNFESLTENINPKDLQTFIKNSGPKARKDFEIGADIMLAELYKNLDGAVGDTAKDAVQEKIYDAEEDIRKATGNLEISHARRHGTTGKRLDNANHEIDYAKKPMAGYHVEMDTPTTANAIKFSGGAGFKNLTKGSKLVYVGRATKKGSISGLRLKEEDSDTLQEMAAILKGGPMDGEAKVNEILKPYM